MNLNLFSVFDPVTIIFSINWISLILFIYLLPQLYWLKFSRLIYLINFVILILFNEFKLILKNKFNLINLFYLLRLFLYIIFNNFIGLFPYIFTASRHIVFSLIFSLSIWLGVIFFGWLKNTFFILVHLVPIGTPFILIFFIVVIESLRNLIRPLTLSIRLVANIVAGHLLLTLLSSFVEKLIIIYIILFILQVLLLILEIIVSIIQAYVFSILIILYLKETN